jgi:hypothetical protein
VAAPNVRLTSEEESRKVAEESRETEWAGRTFLREMFLGNFLLDPGVRDARAAPRVAEVEEPSLHLEGSQAPGVSGVAEHPERVDRLVLFASFSGGYCTSRSKRESQKLKKNFAC